ncbi:MAG: hypothetical protein PHE83_05865 [Opitutaceae bacterium]|nr:hypothetical protein [Opitutaceae bacterium]
MSIGISIKLASDDITPSARALQRGLQPDRLFPIIGRSGVNTIREHLFGLNQTRPNALGGPRTNFYAAAARGTHFDVAADGAQISINQVGIAQRYFGGAISPRKAKYLTIPARAEAYGKRAGEFPDLVVLWGRHGPYALARAAQSAVSFRRGRDGRYKLIKGGARGGEVLFWLVKSATQPPDETVLPSDEAMRDQLDRDVGSYVQRLHRRGADTTGGAS